MPISEVYNMDCMEYMKDIRSPVWHRHNAQRWDAEAFRL